MNSPTMIIALRLIHILGGIFWVGGMVLATFFLAPALRATGPQAGRVMQELVQRRRLPIYMSAVAGLTILSGLLLYGRLAALTNGAWAATRVGRTYGVGAAAALLGMAIGFAIVAPAGRKLGALGAQVQASGGPPSSEQASQIAALQSRMGRGNQVVAALLLVAAAAMAVARYV